MITAIGPFLTKDACGREWEHRRDLRSGAWSSRSQLWSTPAAEIRRCQSTYVPVRFGAGGPAIGQIVHFELDHRSEKAWCVAELDDHVAALADRGDVFWSPSWTAHADGTDIQIRSLEICLRPQTSGLLPIQFLAGDLAFRGASRRWPGSELDGYRRRLCERAESTVFERRCKNVPLVVFEEGAPGRSSSVLDEWDRPAGPLQFRSAAATHVDGRDLEVLALPYEEPTIVEHHGKVITEICTRGAFAGSERRRIKVNRDHQFERTIGRVTSLDTNDPAGLLASIRVAKTPLGDESIALIEDGILEVSAGFAIPPNGSRWETSTRRRLTRCHLHHLSLVPEAAYQSARVLSMRTAGESPTPNLDAVRQLVLTH